MKHERLSSSRAAGAAVLQSQLTDALMRSALIELAKHGYSNLALGAVARRAKVGKPSLYRRWRGKADMVADLLVHFGIPLVAVDDLGSLEKELEAYAKGILDMLKRPLARAILPDLYGELARDTALSEHLKVHFQEPKRAQAMQIVDRAIARGEVSADVERTLALDLMAGPLYWRLMISKDPVDDGFAQRFGKLVAGALRAS